MVISSAFLAALNPLPLLSVSLVEDGFSLVESFSNPGLPRRAPHAWKPLPTDAKSAQQLCGW